MGDSLLAKPRLEPLTVLAAVAARTGRVRLGTSVLLAAMRHPLLLAHASQSLDLSSQGRLVLAVGVGDGFISISESPEAYTQIVERVRHHTRKLGKDFSQMETACYLTVNLNQDQDRAKREADQFITTFDHPYRPAGVSWPQPAGGNCDVRAYEVSGPGFPSLNE